MLDDAVGRQALETISVALTSPMLIPAAAPGLIHCKRSDRPNRCRLCSVVAIPCKFIGRPSRLIEWSTPESLSFRAPEKRWSYSAKVRRLVAASTAIGGVNCSAACRPAWPARGPRQCPACYPLRSPRRHATKPGLLVQLAGVQHRPPATGRPVDTTQLAPLPSYPRCVRPFWCCRCWVWVSCAAPCRPICHGMPAGPACVHAVCWCPCFQSFVASADVFSYECRPEPRCS